mgnify:CR=1 FL=1
MIKIKESKKNTKLVKDLKHGDFFKFASYMNTINADCDHIFIKVEELFDYNDENSDNSCYDLTSNKVFSLKDDEYSEIRLLNQINKLEFEEI